MKKEEKWHPLDVVVNISTFAFKLFSEIIVAAANGKLPWIELLVFGLAANVLIFFKVDYYVFEWAFKWYPTGFGYHFYWFVCSFGPFFIWSFWQQVRRPAIQRFLKAGFDNAGLKNGSGGYPKFISDEEVDDVTRRMRFAHNGVTIDDFKNPEKISRLEHQWGITIDEVERRDERPLEVEILYGYGPKDTGIYELHDFDNYPDYTFPIGRVRGSVKTASIPEIAHLLVAGSTTGGKSTFIRSLVTVLRSNNYDCDIRLFDLKGELDAQVFENAEKISTFGNVTKATAELTSIDEELDTRMKVLREAKVTDINAYNRLLKKKAKKPEYNGPTSLGRLMVIIDECSELLQKNSEATLEQVETSRRVVNRIARMGRAVGIHLVLGVQYPTQQSIDPTVKANIPAVLCFFMANHTGSVVALGNTKANHLSSDRAGAAIWQFKNKHYELQAPYIAYEKVAEIMSFEGKVRGNEDGLYAGQKENQNRDKAVFEKEFFAPSRGSDGSKKSVALENHDNNGSD